MTKLWFFLAADDGGVELFTLRSSCGNDHKKWRHTVNSLGGVVLVNNGHDSFLHHLEHPSSEESP